MKTERILSTTSRLEAENNLKELMQGDADIFDNPYLFVRTGLLAKFLVLNEIYQKILDVPGNIIEVGSWYGQSSILFENLRAIHENFNNTRKIISLDTFEGYVENSGLEIAQNEIDKYNTSTKWLESLESIQQSHKRINNSSTEFINSKGDVKDTLPKLLKELQEPVALVYYDIATYDTLEATFNAILPYVGRGSVFIFDDFGTQYKGVNKFLMENKIFQKYQVKHCTHYKSKLYLTFE